jgi:hypothetical protein
MTIQDPPTAPPMDKTIKLAPTAPVEEQVPYAEVVATPVTYDVSGAQSTAPKPVVYTATTTKTTVPAPSRAKRTSNPPPGCPAGGVWGSTKLIGSKTWSICAIVSVVTCFFILLPCGLFALCCPCDDETVYTVNGNVFNMRGQCLGPASNYKVLSHPWRV